MKIYEATEQAYKNGYEAGKPKWISVEDRLPEMLVDVLVYDRTGGSIELAFMTKHCEWVGVCMNHEVTHWMPLPEPPKGECV